MPMKPKKPCKHPRCPHLTNNHYCDQHANQYISDRANAYERGYSSQWQKARKQFLAKNPLCAECERTGKLTQATVVDHIKPHRGDKMLFWDEKNWQPLCKKCHDRKTGSSDRYSEYRY